jgi:hypothetical protein
MIVEQTIIVVVSLPPGMFLEPQAHSIPGYPSIQALLCQVVEPTPCSSG